jgi:glycosyltransferase involved in cell wall biosynthesis
LSSTSLRILYIAYPLLPVSDTSAGGAEQMLWTLEREMHRRGHQTTVAACAGSSVSGRLVATGEVPLAPDTYEQRDREHRHAIRELLKRESFDLIHDESGSFFGKTSDIADPILATLHLPRHFYRDLNWQAVARNVRLNCVSRAQAQTFSNVPNLSGWVANGIALERFPLKSEKNGSLLWMGRICEEKAPHLAIRAARRAGRHLVLAGQVYPFRYHQEYFAREVEPYLGGDIEFVDTPTFAQKLELLSNASTLLVPSLVDETSSLVAIEAMACGTPVIAFRRGALPEVVDHESTGYLVSNVDEILGALKSLDRVRPENCRTHVEQKFSSRRMADDYFSLYERILSRAIGEVA